MRINKKRDARISFFYFLNLNFFKIIRTTNEIIIDLSPELDLRVEVTFDNPFLKRLEGESIEVESSKCSPIFLN